MRKQLNGASLKICLRGYNDIRDVGWGRLATLNCNNKKITNRVTFSAIWVNWDAKRFPNRRSKIIKESRLARGCANLRISVTLARFSKFLPSVYLWQSVKSARISHRFWKDILGRCLKMIFYQVIIWSPLDRLTKKII